MDDEKRCNKRVPISAAARLSYSSNKGLKTIEGTVANISLAGIGLYADCMLSKGTKVSIRIRFVSTDGILRTDEIEGSLINANEIEGLCYLCIAFNDVIKPQKQPFLYEHLHEILSQY